MAKRFIPIQLTNQFSNPTEEQVAKLLKGDKTSLLFTPETIVGALESMSDAEVELLLTFAAAGTPEEFPERATAWLIRHGHSGRAVLVVEEGEVN